MLLNIRIDLFQRNTLKKIQNQILIPYLNCKIKIYNKKISFLNRKGSLTNGSKKKIINWYYYRNKKLNGFLNKSFSKNENNFDDKQLSITTKFENNQGSKSIFNEDSNTMDYSDETKTSDLTKNILNLSNSYNTFNNNQNNQPYKIVWIPAFVYQPQYSPLLTLPNLRF